MKNYQKPSFWVNALNEKDVMFASGEYIGTDPGFGSEKDGGVF